MFFMITDERGQGPCQFSIETMVVGQRDWTETGKADPSLGNIDFDTGREPPRAHVVSGDATEHDS